VPKVSQLIPRALRAESKIFGQMSPGGSKSVEGGMEMNRPKGTSKNSWESWGEGSRYSQIYTKFYPGKNINKNQGYPKRFFFSALGLLRRLSLREKAGEMGSDSLSNSTTLGHKPNSGLSDTTRDDEAKCVPGKVERTESGVLPARGSWLWVSARLLELQTQVHRVSKAEDDTSEHVRSLAWEARSDHRQNCRQREPP